VECRRKDIEGVIPVQEVLWTVDEGIFDSVPQLETLDIRPVLLLLPCIPVHFVMHAYVYLILQSWLEFVA
jgi:hypothetical protein